MPRYWQPADIEPLRGEIDPDAMPSEYYLANIAGWIPPDNPTDLYAQAVDGFADIWAAPDRDTFLWRALNFVLTTHYGAGFAWRPQYQRRGTCVGQGHKLGADVLMALAQLTDQMTFPGTAAVAPIYAGSRVDIAGRPGPWDGSNGSWACRFLREFGVVTLAELELDPQSREEDERLAVRWCASRDGVPTREEGIARTRPILTTPLVQSPREAGKLIQAGNPVIQCSNYIPNGRRDDIGFSPAVRSGGHCTAFLGVRYDPFGLLYANSWGDWGHGPMWPDDQPQGSVWVTERDADRMIGQQDTHALIGIRGLAPLPPSLGL
jgi:hypothetical protein